MARRLLFVVCLVLLAGCSLVADGGEPAAPTDTLTPAPVPTASATSTPGQSPLPPGVTTGGTVNPSTLATAHVRAVAGTGYVWAERQRTLTATGDGNWTVARNHTQTIRFVDDRTYRWHRSARVVWNDLTIEYRPEIDRFADGSVRYTREGAVDDAPTYRAREATEDGQAFAVLAASRIQMYLTVSDATVSIGRVDGERRYWVRSTGSGVLDDEFAENYTVGALVTPRGFVQRLDVTYTTERRGTPVRIEYEFEYRRVGDISLTRPDWLTHARSELEREGRLPDGANQTLTASPP